MSINVFWNDQARMSFSCCAQLNHMLDHYATKHFALGDPRPEAEGAVIIFHGGNQAASEVAEQMNRWARGRAWVIWVSVGDENSDFEYHKLVHENSRLWVQTAKPGKSSAECADRFLLEGAPAICRELLEGSGQPTRIYDWMFAGQINHPRRERMAEILRAYPYGATAMLTTQSFGAGLPHIQYYELMKQAHVVPCPSGLCTPDSFRFAEALEAGCVPVLDGCAPDGVWGYWDLVLGNDHPFYIVQDWMEFPDICRHIMHNGNWRREQAVCAAWWMIYKTEFLLWLERDINELGGEL